MINKLLIVGGSPSSGTTLVADLLDSVAGWVCPPELYIFCFPESIHWNSEALANSIETKRQLRYDAPYGAPRPFFSEKHFSLLGLVPHEAARLTRRSHDAFSFADLLAERISRFYGRSIDCFCEKTPINVTNAGVWSSCGSNTTYLDVVRSGTKVIPSLMRRGYCIYEATLIWLCQSTHGRSASKLKNYVRLRYEDLTANPYALIADLATKFDSPTHPAEIKERFGASPLRKGIPRPNSWTHAFYEGTVSTTTASSLPESDLALIWSSQLWSLRFKSPMLIADFRDQQRHFGYGGNFLTPVEPAYAHQKRVEYIRRGRHPVAQVELLLTFGDEDPIEIHKIMQRESAAETERLRRKLKKVHRRGAKTTAR